MSRQLPLHARSAALCALIACATLAACLEPPGVGVAADPGRAKGRAPWSSSTTNADLEKKLALLNDILDAKLTGEQLAGRVEKDFPDQTPDERKASLAGITTLMEDLKSAGRAGQAVPPGPDRDNALGQLYFSERRFIEAATLESKVLDANPIYPGARNTLARCFFFLEHRDRALAELKFILENPEQQKDRGEVLDALFLMGAVVAETPGMSREDLEAGKNAWETYLKLAPESPQRDGVERGLEQIRAGLRGEGPLAQPLVPQGGAGSPDAPKNVMGGPAQGPARGPMQGPADTGPKELRAPKLAKAASAYDRALALGLDALDARDLATAETQLNAALKEKPTSPEALTGLGRVYVQSGRIPEALKSFGTAIKTDPGFMPAWHYNGMAHMMAGAPAEAVKSWEKILAADPAYAQKFQLDRRIEVARRMAQ